MSSTEIHVWWASLDDLNAACQDHFVALLSPDEADRAARFHFDRDRLRFVAGRGLLRLLIGRYLGADPGRIQLSYGPHGKPELPPAGKAIDLRFNASGSGGVALYALTNGREVGVDVEQHRPIPDADRIAARSFSPREQLARRPVPAPDREAAFFAVWTRKEAYVKATGEGLSRPFGEFTVSIGPDGAPDRIEDGRDSAAGDRWAFREPALLPGFSAAICAEAPIGRVHVIRVEP